MDALRILLTCPICLENLENPRTLNCLHSFCTECIIKIQTFRPTMPQHIPCPVCKCVTHLVNNDVYSLPIDFRSQQILDITCSESNQPSTILQQQTPQPYQQSTTKCDCCSRLGHQVESIAQCIQCQMLFCGTCNEKHATNRLFLQHTVINVSDVLMFCNFHEQCPAKYICRLCKVLLCTVCTLDHDGAHNVEEFVPDSFEIFKNWLSDALICIDGKLVEQKQYIDHIEHLREDEMRRRGEIQSTIVKNADNIVRHVRRQQAVLLFETSVKFEEAIKDIASIEELKTELANIENVKKSIESAINEPLRKSFLDSEVLKSEMETVMKKMNDHQAASAVSRSNIIFVPFTGINMNALIGCLQDCRVNGENFNDVNIETPSTGSTSPSSRKRHNLMTTILSPPKKQIHLGLVKNSARKLFRTGLGGETCFGEIGVTVSEYQNDGDVLRGIVAADSATSLSNLNSLQADTVMLNSESFTNCPSPSSPSSTTDHFVEEGNPTPHERFCISPRHVYSSSLPRLIFCVEQQGSLIGQLIKPRSAAFVDDDNLVVAESESRLQIFNGSYQRKEIYFWGKVRPLGLAVLKSKVEGPVIFYTDLKDRTVKWFKTQQKELISYQSWPASTFSAPSAIAINSKGFIVISDIEYKCVSVHQCTQANGQLNMTNGQLIFKINDSTLAMPTYLAVDVEDNIYVSDQELKCVKVYDWKGTYKLTISLPQSGPVTPHGICIYNTMSQLFVCQPESAKVLKFNLQGDYIGFLELSSQLTCPINVAFDPMCKNLVVVESSNTGFGSYHAIKVFNGF